MALDENGNFIPTVGYMRYLKNMLLKEAERYERQIPYTPEHYNRRAVIVHLMEVTLEAAVFAEECYLNKNSSLRRRSESNGLLFGIHSPCPKFGTPRMENKRIQL